MGELDLDRGPLASGHEADRVPPHRHAVLAGLPWRLDGRVGDLVSNVCPFPFDGKRHPAPFVVSVQVARQGLESHRERGRVQREVCQGAHVLRIVVLPEVESETGVAGGLGRRFEETSKDGTGDEPVRVRDVPAR